MLGMGKLGLPVALAIESKGHEVLGYDISSEPAKYLEEKEIPYKEKDLQPLLDENKIKMVDKVEGLYDADIMFVSVQTPHDERFDGSTPMPKERADFDYKFLENAIESVKDYKGVLAVISTCLPGTYKQRLKKIKIKGKYVYTPQFIAMGTVLDDYLNPEFNLIGIKDRKAADTLEKFYETINDAPSIKTDITTAEGIKVSYNTWITAKIVMANVWGEMSDKLGMNFDDIKRAWDVSTRRIHSPRYTDSGMGDGGGCHPRDNIALSYVAQKIGMSSNIWEDLMRTREKTEFWHASIVAKTSAATKLPILVLGRSFKPETNIETGSPALLMASFLQGMGLTFDHLEDYNTDEPKVVFIATKHDKYKKCKFAEGSVVIDPFGYIKNQEGVTVRRLGRE